MGCGDGLTLGVGSSYSDWGDFPRGKSPELFRPLRALLFIKELHDLLQIGLSSEPSTLFSGHRLLSVVNKERLAVPLFSFCLETCTHTDSAASSRPSTEDAKC